MLLDGRKRDLVVIYSCYYYMPVYVMSPFPIVMFATTPNTSRQIWGNGGVCIYKNMKGGKESVRKVIIMIV